MLFLYQFPIKFMEGSQDPFIGFIPISHDLKNSIFAAVTSSLFLYEKFPEFNHFYFLHAYLNYRSFTGNEKD